VCNCYSRGDGNPVGAHMGKLSVTRLCSLGYRLWIPAFAGMTSFIGSCPASRFKISIPVETNLWNNLSSCADLFSVLSVLVPPLAGCELTVGRTYCEFDTCKMSDRSHLQVALPNSFEWYPETSRRKGMSASHSVNLWYLRTIPSMSKTSQFLQFFA
jgi:hypothetical protein